MSNKETTQGKLGPPTIKHAGALLVRISDKPLEVEGHYWTTYTPDDDEMSDTIFEFCADCGRLLRTK